VTATCEAKHVGALLRENGFEWRSTRRKRI
jgi:hypothetical protein